MADRPVNLLEPEVRSLRANGTGKIRRPGSAQSPGLLGRSQVKDRLWIREPFHLYEPLDHLTPTAAAALTSDYAVACWPADSSAVRSGDTGVRRFARSMPRVLHRAHLVVIGRRFFRLQEITDAEIAEEGHATQEAFARAWDSRQPNARTISGSAVRWADNPRLVELAVEWMGRPL